jgi:hypothetical protein
MISKVTNKYALENYIKVIRNINTCRPVQSNQNTCLLDISKTKTEKQCHTSRVKRINRHFKNGTNSSPVGGNTYNKTPVLTVPTLTNQQKQSPLLNVLHFCSMIHHLLHVYKMCNWTVQNTFFWWIPHHSRYLNTVIQTVNSNLIYK